MGVISGSIAIWASETYRYAISARGYYYAMTGYPSATADLMAARDAAARTGTATGIAWILFAAAIAAMIAAIAVRPDVAPVVEAGPAAS